VALGEGLYTGVSTPKWDLCGDSCFKIIHREDIGEGEYYQFKRIITVVTLPYYKYCSLCTLTFTQKLGSD